MISKYFILHSIKDYSTVKSYNSKFQLLIDQLIDIRCELRKNKQWKLADIIRKNLHDVNIGLKDTVSRGTRWYVLR